MQRGQRHPGYGIVFFPALQQDTTQMVGGAGGSVVLFTDAGAGLETFTGSGASALRLTDAGSGAETFTGTGASAVRVVDVGVGLEQFIGGGASSLAFTDIGSGVVSGGGSTPVSGSGSSLVVLVDDGSGQRRVFIPGGGPPPRPQKTTRKTIDRPLKWEPWSPEPEAPTYVAPDRVLPRAEVLRALAEQREPSLDPVIGPALERRRAAARLATWHAAHDTAGVGSSSTLQCSSTGRGRVIPADMMSALKQLAAF